MKTPECPAREGQSVSRFKTVTRHYAEHLPDGEYCSVVTKDGRVALIWAKAARERADVKANTAIYTMMDSGCQTFDG